MLWLRCLHCVLLCCGLAWWRHQMEPFSALLALCAGNSPVPVNSPHKGQWRGAVMSSLICAWINDWVNNREAGDLRRHRGQDYDVIVMVQLDCINDIQGPFHCRDRLFVLDISILTMIRWDRLIFITGILIQVRWHFYTETVHLRPRSSLPLVCPV